MTFRDHRHVLVVEDEYHQASLLAVYLGLEGYDVLGPVGSVSAALDLIGAESTIDCAILDVNLAGEESYAIADALRERHVPFLFVTGYDSSILPPEYAGIEVKTKPVHLPGLTDTLERLLKH